MAHVSGLRKALAKKFDDELRFFKGWIDKPKAVGSIVPTSSITARRMASVVDPDSGLPVLEVGPGTGVITRAILARGVKPGRLYASNIPPISCAICGTPFRASTSSRATPSISTRRSATRRGTDFDCVVSGVPLLNFPVARRIGYIEGLLDRIPPGGRSCSSPMARCRRCRRAAATTRSSISIS